MAEPLKNMYNPAFFESLCPVLKENIPGFECSYFIHRVFNNRWPDLEFNERVTHIAKVINDFLPEESEAACEILMRVSNYFRHNGNKEHAYVLIFIAEWIQLFGPNCLESSLAALKEITKLVSVECIIRPHPATIFEFQLESLNN